MKGDVGNGWLNPARLLFWQYVLCYLLSFSFFKVYLQSVISKMIMMMI